MFMNENDLWCFSITVTGRCNCACSYCHYYANRNRKDYNRDINFNLFKNYSKLLKIIKEKHHSNIRVRFSGGDPLVLGDYLFELSNYLYKETGIKPYILTNGKAITKEIIEKSIQNNISGFYTSLENPFDNDKGAPRTIDTLKKIKDFNCDEIFVKPGVMIIKNDMFKHLCKISDFLYEEIGELPTFSELTYLAYESPTDKQLDELKTNVEKIVTKFFDKTPLSMFPYISPELVYGDFNHYLTELDIDNKFKISDNNLESIVCCLYEQLKKSYVENLCDKKSCDWYEDCKKIKWIWTQETPKTNKNQKFNDYCNLKKCINSAFYKSLIGAEENEIKFTEK